MHMMIKTTVFVQTIVWIQIFWIPVSVVARDQAPLCSLPPITYADAKQKHSEAAFALHVLEQLGIATWYSDREVNRDYVATAQQLVAKCPDSSRLVVVVYGLPQKDCDAKYSSIGSRNQNAADYEAFIQKLATIIGQRKILYVLEPDAIGLLAKDDHNCAHQAGYQHNLQMAINVLSSNPNAEIYLDVGYWALADEQDATRVVNIITQLTQTPNQVKGITLNTSNYRSNDELARLCGSFQQRMGKHDAMHCIIDTSRNYGRSRDSKEWCNSKTAGIGNPPTATTGYDNIDYFVWIKPPGDSDGACDQPDRTPDALAGPEAGVFFQRHFEMLWNQGYLVHQLKLPPIQEPSETTDADPTAIHSRAATHEGSYTLCCLVSCIIGWILLLL